MTTSGTGRRPGQAGRSGDAKSGAGAPAGTTAEGQAGAASRAKGRGADKQVLVYEPSGPIGGTFVCSRCGAAAPHPDLLGHRPECPYLDGEVPRG